MSRPRAATEQRPDSATRRASGRGTGERGRTGNVLVAAGMLAAAVWSVFVVLDLPALMAEFQWLMEAPLLPATYLGLHQGLPAASGSNVVAIDPSGGKGQPPAARQYRQFRVLDGGGRNWDLYFRDEDDGLNRTLLALHLAHLPKTGEQVPVRGYPDHPETSKLALVPAAHWLAFLLKVAYYVIFFVPAAWLIWLGNRERPSTPG